jgi:hypothetical protein
MIPNSDGMRFGIYEANSNEGKPLAMPVWEWGSFYSKIVHSVFNNTWKKDSLKTKDAINYWWGMSSGMIDILVSGQIPSRVKFLIETLKKAVQQDFMHPFEGEIYDQDGNLKNQNGEVMDPNDIMWMDWLVDNVVGTIPNRDELIDSAKTVVEIQGVKKGDRSTQ